jgi:general L-amino acid transport system substrate-binding protein
MSRDTSLGLKFAGVMYYDGQGFLINKAKFPDVTSALQLGGAAVCTQTGTTTELNLADFSSEKSLVIKPLILDSHADAFEAFLEGRCKAYTSDSSVLASERLAAPGGAGEYLLLPERISEEPTGPVVRRGDEEWLRLVRWTLFALIEAEERGVTRANVRKLQEAADDPALAAFLGKSSGPGKALGLSADWVTRVVESVGNYAEIFDRNLGRQSPLQLDRGLNRLWKDGGLMYSPPFR